MFATDVFSAFKLPSNSLKTFSKHIKRVYTLSHTLHTMPYTPHHALYITSHGQKHLKTPAVNIQHVFGGSQLLLPRVFLQQTYKNSLLFVVPNIGWNILSACSIALQAETQD